MSIPKTLFVSANTSPDDYGLSDGPTCAKIALTADLVARITELEQLAITHRLSEVRTSGAPDAWGPIGVSDEMRFSMAELVVLGPPGSTQFYFVDVANGLDARSETSAISIDTLREWLAGAEDTIYFNEYDDLNDDDFRDTVAEDLNVEAAVAPRP